MTISWSRKKSTGTPITAVNDGSKTSRFPYPNKWSWDEKVESGGRSTMSLIDLNSQNIKPEIRSIGDVAIDDRGELRIMSMVLNFEFLQPDGSVNDTLPSSWYSSVIHTTLMMDRTKAEASQYTDMVSDRPPHNLMQRSAVTLYDLFNHFGKKFKPVKTRDAMLKQLDSLADTQITTVVNVVDDDDDDFE